MYNAVHFLTVLWVFLLTLIMVTGMWLVMEPQEKWDTYSCSDLAHCIRSFHLLASQTHFQWEKQDCCNFFQVVFVAQKMTFLETDEVFSYLFKGAVHVKQEHGSSKLVPLNCLYAHVSPALTCSHIAYPALYLVKKKKKRQKRWCLHRALTTEKYMYSSGAIRICYLCVSSEESKEGEQKIFSYHYCFFKVLNDWTHFAKVLFASSHICFIIINFVSSF